jgi:hypothetical protein
VSSASSSSSTSTSTPKTAAGSRGLDVENMDKCDADGATSDDDERGDLVEQRPAGNKLRIRFVLLTQFSAVKRSFLASEM